MDLRVPCLLCYWRKCSCGREQRAAERDYLDRLAERNERAARIRKLRRGTWWQRFTLWLPWR